MDGQCWIRCPWHGRDSDPLTGKSPGGHADSGQTLYPTRVDANGGIHVGLAPEPVHTRTVSDVMAQKQVFGAGAFQDIDLESALQAVTRLSQTVQPVSNHAELMSLACKAALVERDMAHLIFPDDVQTLPSAVAAGGPAGCMGGAAVLAAEGDLTQAADMVIAARRPMIAIGHGAVPARAAVIQLAEPRDGQDIGLPDQQHGIAGADDLRALQEPLAG